MDYLLFLHLLREKGFSMQGLAEMLGVSKQVLYRRVTGRMTLRREHIAKLIKALDMDTETVYKIFFPELELKKE